MNRRDAIRAVMAMPAVASVSVAQVKPDDVIVLECDQLIGHEAADRIRQMAERVWPDHSVGQIPASEDCAPCLTPRSGPALAGAVRLCVRVGVQPVHGPSIGPGVKVEPSTTALPGGDPGASPT